MSKFLGVLAEVRCEQPEGLVIREKEFRKLGPILAHIKMKLTLLTTRQTKTTRLILKYIVV